MSTSKGQGAAAHRIVEVVPPDQLRFLFIRPRPNSAIEFDPDGTDAIPRLFDEFDRVADAAAGREVKGTLPPSPERLFAYAVLPTDPAVVAERAAAFRLAFAHVAFLIQQPAGGPARHRGCRREGAPLTRARGGSCSPSGWSRRGAGSTRMRRTRPGSRVRTDRCPPRRPTLDDAQRAFLGALADRAARPDAPRPRRRLAGVDLRDGQGASTCPPGAPSRRSTRAFLGRTSGPRAGWLLASLDRAFVIARLTRPSGASGTRRESDG